MTRSSSQGFRRVGVAALFWLGCTSYTWAQTSTINIQARSTLAANVGAIMQVRLNAVVVGSVEVRAAAWQTYSFNVPTGALPGGAIDVVFTNDALINAQDRNLYVLSVGVNGLNLSPTALGVVYDRGVGPAAFDGMDLAAASTGMPWAGALRFPALPAAVAPPTSPAPVVSFEYDANGNPTKTVQAPGVAGLNLATGSSYDTLNRLKDTTDASSGVVRFAYNGQDGLTQVTDPRNLVTQTPRNGLGDVTQLVSPDTGTANATYDAAGNLKTRTDSRGAVATYTYDALNRPTGVSHQLGTETSAFGWLYDEPASTFGVGRLTSMTFPAGSVRYRYDPQGRVVGTSQVINSVAGGNAAAVTRAVGYAYDVAGNLTQLTYPSGRQLVITYAGGQVSALSLAATVGATPVALIADMAWEPFGGVSRWQWQLGSGPQLHERVYDSHGRLIRYRLGPTLRTITYDAADRITAYSHVDATNGVATPALDQSFGYDAAGRLNSVTAAASTWTFSYDANGNRTSQVLNGVSRAYSVSTTSNRLDALSNPARSFGFDTAGNTTSDTALAHAPKYNAAGRLASVMRGGITTTYSHDAMGLRIRKFQSSGATTTVLFVYDLAGRLLGEYNSTGQAIREYVWLGNTPVAFFTPNGIDAAQPPWIYVIHADHLDTPRVVVDQSNRLRWRWLSEPFGTSAPETNPAGVGAINLPLRFPGQYADAETGLNYNWHRDYDGTVGRYTQSDPIGLAGGINTYAYVFNQPTRYTDPDGRLAIALPWVVPPVVEGLVYIGSAAAAAWGLHKATQSDEQCKDKSCPPCKTVSGRVVPVDTVGYRPLDVIPDAEVQHGVAGSHHNIFIAKQNPNNCQCFWAKQKYVLKPGQLPPGAVPVEPFVN